MTGGYVNFGIDIDECFLSVHDGDIKKIIPGAYSRAKILFYSGKPIIYEGLISTGDNSVKISGFMEYSLCDENGFGFIFMAGVGVFNIQVLPDDTVKMQVVVS